MEVDGWLPLLPEVHLPQLTGQVLADVFQRKGATDGSLDGWGWKELKVLPVSWYDELGSHTDLDIEEVLSGAADSDVHLFVADVIKSFDTVDR